MSEDRAETTAYVPEVFMDEKTKRGVTVLVPQPDDIPEAPYVDNDGKMREGNAAWMQGLHFLTTGVPGGGKNSYVHALVTSCWRSNLYTLQGHGEQEPTDLEFRLRLSASRDGRLVASRLVAAAVHGGVFFYDEISKAPRKCLAMLASVLDQRRTIDSDVAGLRLRAHPRFRVCAAVNPEDPPLPAFIRSRLQVVITIALPSAAQLNRIVRAHFNAADNMGVLLDAFREWVADKTQVAPRAAIGMVRYAEGLVAVDGCQRLTLTKASEYIEEAASRVHGGSINV